MGFRLRGRSVQWIEERRQRVLRAVEGATQRQRGRQPVRFSQLRAKAQEMHAPPYVLDFIHGLLTRWNDQRRWYVLWIGIGGSRWEGPDEERRYKRVSQKDGICELAGMSRTQAQLGRWWVEEHQLLNVHTNGKNSKGRTLGGRGQALGYSAGPALGGPVLDDDAPPEPAAEPVLPPEVIERRRAELYAALRPAPSVRGSP